MIFTETDLPGSYVIEPEYIEDERGFFARSFCVHQFEELGLNPVVAQSNMSFNKVKGTIRGLHFQLPPDQEVKVVRCTQGAIYDVIVDLRPGATHLQSFGVELTAENRKQLYVPEGFAHGYQTLEDDTEVCYQVSEFYAPGNERGLRWDDPSIDIRWPQPITKISHRDLAHADYSSE